MDNAPKKREWVKTVAIIFLAILLALTFFSNTIQNMTLPEVSTVAVDDGSITAKIRATGKVNAVGNNEVKAEGTRTIAAVKVKEGQEVSEGDILFVMGEAGTEELEVATDARDSASWSYERAKYSYPIDTGSTSLSLAEEAMDMANRRLASARDAYDRAAAGSADVEIAKAEMEAAQSIYEGLNSQLSFDITSAQTTVDYIASELTIAQEEYYKDPTSTEKKENVTRLSVELDDARKVLADLQDPSKDRMREVNSAYDEYRRLDAKYNELLKNSDVSAYLAEVNAAESAYNSAVASYESAYASYATGKQQYAQSWQQASINEQEAKQTLDKKQNKVDNLQGIGEDINVYAKVSGIVESVSFSSGDKVVKDDVMCVIEVPDMGYKMDVSVTKDQANRLKVGDVGEAVNYYWGKSVTGTINTIKADPKSPQDKRIITFELEGDVTNGQELTLSVGQKSATYDFIVPKSAVKSDNNGYFVLKIESKSNALGNRYFAKRVNIEILAEDDSNRAISGDIGYGDFIITNSSTKVNSGDQVRLADAS